MVTICTILRLQRRKNDNETIACALPGWESLRDSNGDSFVWDAGLFFCIKILLFHKLPKKTGGEIMQLTEKLEQNLAAIDEALRDCGDIVRREFRIGGNGRLVMFYADNFVDLAAIQESILETVMLDYQNDQTGGILQTLLEEAIAISDVKKITTVAEICDAVFWGDTVLLMDGNDFALQATTKKFPNRGISKAETEVVVQGPKDAFMEVMAFNIVLIRRRIREP